MSIWHGDVTELLGSWGKGDPRIENELFQRVYGELRRIAIGFLSHERRDHTLEPSALVHEVYLRLLRQRGISFEERRQFFALATRMMRRVLIDHERHRRTSKGEAGLRKLELREDVLQSQLPERNLPELAVALERLAKVDPRKASIIELRFFGGMTVKETSQALGCSVRTVNYEWQVAKAWLFRELR